MEVDDLLSMDITELVTVYVGSKREEAVQDAPGILTVITAEDIAKYGANNLQDVLRRVPGVLPTSSFVFRDNVFAIRGMHADSVNEQTLILMNGRPIRERYSDGVITPIIRGFPLHMIEKVEVIRGPGSVLYGSGAFAGVINIVTKKPEKGLNQSAAAGYGSFNTRQFEYQVSGKYDDAAVMVSANSVKSGGWKYETNDVFGVHDMNHVGSEDHSVAATVDYKRLSVNMFRAYSDEETFLGFPAWPHGSFDKSRFFIDVGYTHPLVDDWKSTLNLSYDSFDSSRSNGAFDLFSEHILAEGTVSGSPFEKANLIIGGTFSELRGTDRPSLGHPDYIDFDSIWKSLYSQFDYKPLDWIKLIGGVQMNSPRSGAYDLSPRVGTILNFDKHFGSKLLYSKAFRSPSGAERTFLIPGVFQGNPDLEPETVKTFDAQLFYQSMRYFAAVTYFRSRVEGYIVSDFTLATPTVVNGGDFTFEGFEIEGTAKLNRNFELVGSVSYQDNRQENGLKDTKLVPNLLAKAGVYYQPHDWVSVGVFDTYVGEHSKYENYSSFTQVVNPPADAYHHLTVNVSFDVDEMMDDAALPPTTFTLYGDNLLESDTIYLPDFGSSALNTMPVFPGRALYAKLRISF